MIANSDWLSEAKGMHVGRYAIENSGLRIDLKYSKFQCSPHHFSPPSSHPPPPKQRKVLRGQRSAVEGDKDRRSVSCVDMWVCT